MNFASRKLSVVNECSVPVAARQGFRVTGSEVAVAATENAVRIGLKRPLLECTCRSDGWSLIQGEVRARHT